MTEADNLQPLCHRHHHLKHEAGWDVRRASDGTTIWISPTGRRHEKPPAAYPIDTTLSVVLSDGNDDHPSGGPDANPPVAA